jgi:transcription elongation factor Elf1
MEKKNTLFYTCPKCGKENEVYFYLGTIEDGGSYRFDTECYNCKQALFIKINFNLTVKEV